MDYLLLLGMLFSSAAGVASGCLLRLTVSPLIFWAIILTGACLTPVGFALPVLLAQLRRRPRRSQLREGRGLSTVNVVSANLLTLITGVLMIIIEIMIANQSLIDGTRWEDLARIFGAVMAFNAALSLDIYMFYHICDQERRSIRRLVHILKWCIQRPVQAKLVLCDDLAEEAPGECVICLEELASMPEDMARATRATKDHSGLGLLRLPCGHTFHSSCADRWLARELGCPLCRRHVESPKKCSRICLTPRGGGSPSPGRKAVEKTLMLSPRGGSGGSLDDIWESPKRGELALSSLFGKSPPRQHPAARCPPKPCKAEKDVPSPSPVSHRPRSSFFTCCVNDSNGTQVEWVLDDEPESSPDGVHHCNLEVLDSVRLQAASQLYDLGPPPARRPGPSKPRHVEQKAPRLSGPSLCRCCVSEDMGNQVEVVLDDLA
jgi:hypothetical protein